MLILFPLLVMGLGLSVRPLPLRVDATEPAERRAQHCLRISFLLLAIPAVVMGLIVALLIHRFSGGPGLLAYEGCLSFGGKLWKLSSVAGILCAIGACFRSKRRGDGFQLIATHAILLFLVIVGPYLQYAGHPD
ncbi:MAG TPA: hypothetical protein VN761_11910 [Candidatus Polarisedimenticolia bacterium]|nr:hypothetical protein [Candidatus Polarisedimenticolia bacterium]